MPHLFSGTLEKSFCSVSGFFRSDGFSTQLPGDGVFFFLVPHTWDPKVLAVGPLGPVRQDFEPGRLVRLAASPKNTPTCTRFWSPCYQVVRLPLRDSSSLGNEHHRETKKNTGLPLRIRTSPRVRSTKEQIVSQKRAAPLLCPGSLAFRFSPSCLCAPCPKKHARGR